MSPDNSEKFKRYVQEIESGMTDEQKRRVTHAEYDQEGIPGNEAAIEQLAKRLKTDPRLLKDQ